MQDSICYVCTAMAVELAQQNLEYSLTKVLRISFTLSMCIVCDQHMTEAAFALSFFSFQYA